MPPDSEEIDFRWGGPVDNDIALSCFGFIVDISRGTWLT